MLLDLLMTVHGLNVKVNVFFGFSGYFQMLRREHKTNETVNQTSQHHKINVLKRPAAALLTRID